MIIKTNKKPQSRYWGLIEDLALYVDQPKEDIATLFESQGWLTRKNRLKKNISDDIVKVHFHCVDKVSHVYWKKSIVFPLFQEQGWTVCSQQEYLLRAGAKILAHFCDQDLKTRGDMDGVGVYADIYGTISRQLFLTLFNNEQTIPYAEKILARLQYLGVPIEQCQELKSVIPEHIQQQYELQQSTLNSPHTRSGPRL